MCEVCVADHQRQHPRHPPRLGRPPGTGGKTRPDSLPVAPFRQRAIELHAAGVSWEDMARRVGYDDTRQLKRTLGLVPYTKSKESRQVPGAIYRYRYTQRNVMPDTAKRLARGLGMDPVESGY